uniref:Uncharacterized protein n=1 Tax=Quercus lobata TaxID=97700 RepID=A0A7N2MMA3_QUELO
MGAAAAAVASLLMKMIWKIQQKIPKLSESHDEYDGMRMELMEKVNGCGRYIEAERCKLLPKLGSAEVWASSHNSMIIFRVQANGQPVRFITAGLAFWLAGSLSVNSVPLPEFPTMASALADLC